MKKRSCPGILALAAALLLSLPVATRAQDFLFTTNTDNTIIITGYTGVETDVSIPDTITGLPVTSIGDSAFYYRENLTSVTMGDNVTNIGTGAFASCGGLTNVTFGTNVVVIGNDALSGCIGLTSLLLPASVAAIGDTAFVFCTNLTAVYFLGNAPNVGTLLFERDMATIYFLPDTTGWPVPPAPFDGLPTAFWYLPVPYTCITNADNTITITGYTGDGGDVTIPDTITGLPVTGIAGGFYFFGNIYGGAFEGNTNITSVTFPNSVTNIGNGAFDSCAALTNVVLGANGTVVGYYAFFSCTNLAGVTIPDGVANIEGVAFALCNRLPAVQIPASVTNIGSQAFAACASLVSITVDAANPFYSSANGVLFNKYQAILLQYPSGLAGNYTIPDGVTNIATSAFEYSAGLTGVTIPTGVASLGADAFYTCTNLAGLYFLGNAPKLGSQVFSGDTLATVYFLPGTKGWPKPPALFGGLPTVLVQAPQYVCTINDGGIIITSYTGTGGVVTIPATISGLPVTGIGQNAFRGFDLTSVTIPASVTNIADYAFADCTNLTAAYFQGDAPAADATVFANDNLATAYFLQGTAGWPVPPALFGGIPTAIFQIPGFTYTDTLGVIVITGYTGTGGVVTIPATFAGVPVTSIASNVFTNCTSLAGVTIPAGVTNIEDHAFAGCTNLAAVTFSGNAPGLGLGVFDGDTGATVYFLSGLAWGWPTPPAPFGGLPTVAVALPEEPWSLRSASVGTRSTLTWATTLSGVFLSAPAFTPGTMYINNQLTNLYDGDVDGMTTNATPFNDSYAILLNYYWFSGGSVPALQPAPGPELDVAFAATQKITGVTMAFGAKVAINTGTAANPVVGPVVTLDGNVAGFTVYGSTDDKHWSNVFTSAAITNSGVVARTPFTWPAVAYQYYRIAFVTADSTYVKKSWYQVGTPICLREIQWNCENTANLSVISAYGGALPGMTVTNYGVTVNEYVTNSPVIVNGTTQYVCTGATVTSNAFTQVSPTNVTLVLTNTATLTWKWSTNYWLSIATNGNGSVSPTNSWWLKGAKARITATAGDHAIFSGWSGQTKGCSIKGNVITAPMKTPRALTANFVQASIVTVAADPADGGTVTGGGLFKTNSLVTLQATAKPNWKFAGWADTNLVTASRKIAVPAGDTTYTGLFVMVTGEISLGTNALDFGTVTVGQSATQMVTVSNAGPNAIKITSIHVPSGYKAAPTAFTLASNATLDVMITFKPTSTGVKTGTVSLVSNAARGAAQIVVTGTAQAVAPVVRPQAAAMTTTTGNDALALQIVKLALPVDMSPAGDLATVRVIAGRAQVVPAFLCAGETSYAVTLQADGNNTNCAALPAALATALGDRLTDGAILLTIQYADDMVTVTTPYVENLSVEGQPMPLDALPATWQLTTKSK